MELLDLQDSFLFMAFLAIVLLFLTHLVCARWFKQFPASALSGSVIMVFALYVGECLPHYPLPLWVLKFLMLEVFVVWVYGSVSLLHDFFLAETSGSQSDRSGLSAWVASTVLVAIMIGRLAPLFYGVMLLLTIFAAILWIKYAILLGKALIQHMQNKFRDHISASLLLGSASTACMVWMAWIMFRSNFPSVIYQGLIIISVVLYLVISLMLLRRHLPGNVSQLSSEWSSDYSLLYGVSALIGVVGLMTHVGAEKYAEFTWYWSIVTFFIVTTFDLFLSLIHVRKQLIIYHVEQWLRVFSLMILFVFTWRYQAGHFFDNQLAAWIAEYGLNIITAIVFLQVIYSIYAIKVRHEIR